MAIIDNFSQEELKNLVLDCTSMRELARRLGYSAIGGNFTTIKDRLNKYNISFSHFNGIAKNSIKRTPENVFVTDSTATQATLRRWYLKGNYTEYKCSICGQEPFWNGKELTLTLDHINGINHDDRLENLRWVCPNCDRQLDTFGAKNPNKKIAYNKKEKTYCIDCGKEITSNAIRCVECSNLKRREIERPNRDELKQLIRTTPFTTIGKQFGVSDNTIRKWCKAEKLPYRVTEIKQINDEDWKLI